MEIIAAVIGVQIDNLSAVGYGSLCIYPGRIGILSIRGTDIIIYKFASVTFDCLRSFFIYVPVNGITHLGREHLVSGVDVCREAGEILGLVGRGPEVHCVQDPALRHFGKVAAKIGGLVVEIGRILHEGFYVPVRHDDESNVIQVWKPMEQDNNWRY